MFFFFTVLMESLIWQKLAEQKEDVMKPALVGICHFKCNSESASPKIVQPQPSVALGAREGASRGGDGARVPAGVCTVPALTS